MRQQRILLLPLLFITFLIISLPRAGFASPEEVTRLRIGVTQDGIYRITPGDLTAAEVDPATIDPSTFAMTSLGQPVAIRVVAETGAPFDGDDFIEFFGEKYRGTDPDLLEREMQEKYTDERVYWLDFGGAPGPRISEIDTAPSGALTPPSDFADTIRAEDNIYWFALHTDQPEDKDTWFWKYLAPDANSQTTATASYDIPHPAPGHSPHLTLVLNGRSDLPHRITATVNADPTVYIDGQWTGKHRAVFSADLPDGLIVPGNNDVIITAINDNDSSDALYLNYWELNYRRFFTAWQGQLDFESESQGPTEYEVNGWASTDEVAVWDITDANQPQRLLNASSTIAGNDLTLRFRAENAQTGDRYWLQPENTFLAPASIILHNPTGLRNPTEGADTVIVTTAELLPAAEELATWHEAHGRRTLIALFPDVVDEFNDGIYHPQAIPAMLVWAQDHWPGEAPAYLVLLGDGHWNFKGYNPASYPPQPQIIPPYLAFFDPWQGEVPSEALFGDLDGDTLQDIAVGRLPVNDLEEATVVVNKITGYNEGAAMQAWETHAIFAADNTDDSGDFAYLSDQIIANNLPADFTTDRVYLEVTVADASAGRVALTNDINAGALMIQYAGHGAPYRWTNEAMWHKNYIPDLTNVDQPAVVMTFNCLDGYFAHPSPTYFSMAESMLRYANGGSAAAISPTGLGATYDQHQFRKLLMDILFQEGERELGSALLATKQRFESTYGYLPHYLVSTVSLFGDPAMMLTGPCVDSAIPVSGENITRTNNDVILAWQDVTEGAYQVWRSENPYFDPDVRYDAPLATPNEANYTDIDAIGDAEVNHYYIVTTQSSCEQLSYPVKRMGEFDFALLVPGQ